MKYYLIFNAALILSYLITIFMLKLPTLNQKQQLQFQRKSLVLSLIILLVMPILISLLPVQSIPLLQFQPFIKHASEDFLPTYTQFTSPVLSIHSSFTLPSFSHLLLFVLLSSSLIVLSKYVKEILLLKKMTKNAHCYRKVGRIHILSSAESAIPFCWSSLFTHYIIIPQTFLEKSTDLTFAIRHELQHIRQGDTYWLHFQAFLKICCALNPFATLWNKKLRELQEFACDEALVISKNTSRVHYAQCLIDTARISYSENVLPNEALGMMHHSNNPRSILNRRITMLFQYKNLQKKKTSLIAAYVACVIISSTSAYAITNNAAHGPIATQKIQTLVSQSSTPITITPEIMTEINVIRGNAEARTHMLSSLQRMQQYKNYIATQLQNKGMPQDLLALPLLESGYNMNAKSPIMLTAGIWQFIPNTAKNYNLIINDKRDDRLDTQLSTQAALNYLSALHSQFQDWQLAVIAYEYGEKQTEGFIQKIGSRDPWILARSPKAPADLKKFLAKYNASVIIMNHPELLD